MAIQDKTLNTNRSDELYRLAEFGFLAYVKLSDYEKAVDFLKIHYGDRDTEIFLFVLLKWLRSLRRCLVETGPAGKLRLKYSSTRGLRRSRELMLASTSQPS